MASVWYIGNYRQRKITSKDWIAAGIIGAQDSTWDWRNGWSVPESEFNSSQLNMLSADLEFLTGQVDGPRIFPAPYRFPNFDEGSDLSAYAYYKELRTVFDTVTQGSAKEHVSDVVVRTVSRSTPELWHTFADKADGASPEVLDSGQSSSIYLGSGDSEAPTISNGQLVAHPSGGSSAAWYLQSELKSVVTRIGARFVFAGGSNSNGSAALGICNQRIVTVNGVEQPPDMSLHLTVTPTAWTYGVWSGPNNGNGFLQLIGSGNFITPLAADGITEHEVEAFIVGNTVTIDLPDGTRKVFTDSRIGDSSYGGAHVFFEQYANNSDADNTTAFTHLWATSGRSKPKEAEPFRGWSKVFVGDQSGTATIISAYSPVTVPGFASDNLVIAPPSGEILVRLGCYLLIPDAASMYVGVVWATANANGTSTNLISEDAGNRHVSSVHHISGLVPGTTYSLTPQVNSSVAGSGAQCDPANFKNTIITVDPVY